MNRRQDDVDHRRQQRNQRSALGVILDPIADKGLLLSGIITLSITNWSELDPNYGKFPLWFPVLVITRDVVILVGSAILHLLNGKVRVKTSWTGKVATVLQMAASVSTRYRHADKLNKNLYKVNLARYAFF